ncbi:MAG TPA: DMT family transporter [Alphaproteobacteria bacterium]|nr:DMT family transporter [Alphaproteobacteria bacterium]
MTTSDQAKARRRAFLLLVLAVVCFGTVWPVSKIGLSEATPIWFAAVRAALGMAASFALLAALGRLRLPSRADLPVVLSIGLLQLTAFFALMNLGLRYVPAGRSIVLGYTTTLWLVPLALLSGERIGVWRALGVGVGLAGVALLCNPLAIDWTQGRILGGHAALLLAALAWAFAIFHARRHVWQHSPLELLPWQFLTATVLLVLFAVVLEPAGGIGRGSDALLALLYIGVIAGPLATWASTSVARVLPTLTTSLGFLGVPVLGMLFSTLWLGEPLSSGLLAGAGLVLAGLLLVVLGSASG